MFIYKNPNPCKCLVGDCVIRAIAIAMNKPWRDIYLDLCTQGLLMCDMPSSNAVWKAYLLQNDYIIKIPDESTIAAFAAAHTKGAYIIGTGEHAVAVINGNYYDTWDSGQETPAFYLTRENEVDV